MCVYVCTSAKTNIYTHTRARAHRSSVNMCATTTPTTTTMTMSTRTHACASVRLEQVFGAGRTRGCCSPERQSDVSINNQFPLINIIYKHAVYIQMPAGVVYVCVCNILLMCACGVSLALSPARLRNLWDSAEQRAKSLLGIFLTPETAAASRQQCHRPDPR